MMLLRICSNMSIIVVQKPLPVKVGVFLCLSERKNVYYFGTKNASTLSTLSTML